MRRLAVAVFIAATLAGCGTSPEPDYFTLAPITGGTAPDISATIEIERPTLPGYLDRPDIVRQTGTYQVDIDETRRWAAPLDEMFETVLAEDLRQRMPGASIVTERDDLSSKPRFMIDIAIENFNMTDEGALLSAELSITDNLMCKTKNTQSAQVHINTTGTDGMSDLSELIGKFADGIPALMREKLAACCPSPCTNRSDTHKRE